MGSEPGERRRSHDREGLFRRAHAYTLHRIELSPSVQHVIDRVHELSRRLTHRRAIEHEIEGRRHEQGRGLGLSR
jgi:hypothetical protein